MWPKHCMFTDVPGWEWGESFLERNPTVSVKFATDISKKRAPVNEETINKYFDHLETEWKDVPASCINGKA